MKMVNFSPGRAATQSGPKFYPETTFSTSIGPAGACSALRGYTTPTNPVGTS